MLTTTDGLRIHHRDEGSGDPVLLLHGFPLRGSMWDETIQRLAGQWRLIVPDLRGHGASDAGDDASMQRLALDAVELLDSLGIREPCVVVGLSMGGYVALEMARSWPERIRALVLVDTRAEADSDQAATGRRNTAQRVLRDGTGDLADEMIEKLLSPSAPDELRATWREIMAQTEPAGAAAALRGMASRDDSMPTLTAWTRPLLVVVGEDDRITPPDAARAMHAAVPHSELAIIPRAGHLVPVEQPDRFAADLTTFLEKLPPLR